MLRKNEVVSEVSHILMRYKDLTTSELAKLIVERIEQLTK
jgi:hypothetical protein